jgi:hypothetical protein
MWVYEDGYTTNVTHDHADAYLMFLAKQDHSNAHKDNCRKALQMLYKWREHEHGLDEWNPELSFSTGHKTTAPRDYLTREERGLIHEVALEHGSVPAYESLDAAERDRWKAYLAQRLEKQKPAVTRDDWEEVDGWKIPSLGESRRRAPSDRSRTRGDELGGHRKRRATIGVASLRESV